MWKNYKLDKYIDMMHIHYISFFCNSMCLPTDSTTNQHIIFIPAEFSAVFSFFFNTIYSYGAYVMYYLY